MRPDDTSRAPDIEGKLRHFNRVLMSYVDFQQAAGIAGYVLSENLHVRYPEGRFILQGLNCGMIVAYCRPFSGNDRGADIKIPDLPARVLKTLSLEERELHATVMEDRNTVLAHSDSQAWQPQPILYRLRGQDRLFPVFNDAHAPLTREATERFLGMCRKLMKACFDERLRLEPELRPYLPVVECSEEDLKRVEKKIGAEWPT